VECALKACIAKRTRRYDFPDRKFVSDVYTHDLGKLLRLTGLVDEHERECIRNPTFDLNWTMIKDWSEQARYNIGVDWSQAASFRRAVVSRRNGVLPWLQKWW